MHPSCINKQQSRRRSKSLRANTRRRSKHNDDVITKSLTVELHESSESDKCVVQLNDDQVRLHQHSSPSDQVKSSSDLSRRTINRSKKCIVHFFKFALSHVGLALLVVAYVIVGGLVFQRLEGGHELDVKHKVLANKTLFVDQLMQLWCAQHVQLLERISKDVSRLEAEKSRASLNDTVVYNYSEPTFVPPSRLNQSQLLDGLARYLSGLGWSRRILPPSWLPPDEVNASVFDSVRGRRFGRDYESRKDLELGQSNSTAVEDSNQRKIIESLGHKILLGSQAIEAEIEAKLKQHITNIVNAVKDEGWNGADNSDEINWTIEGGILFAVTIITTIGYGHVTPHTALGKFMTMMYAVVGIPLFFSYLSNSGDYMAEIFHATYIRLCRPMTNALLDKCCGGRRKRDQIVEHQRDRRQYTTTPGLVVDNDHDDDDGSYNRLRRENDRRWYQRVARSLQAASCCHCCSGHQITKCKRRRRNETTVVYQNNSIVSSSYSSSSSESSNRFGDPIEPLIRPLSIECPVEEPRLRSDSIATQLDEIMLASGTGSTGKNWFPHSPHLPHHDVENLSREGSLSSSANNTPTTTSTSKKFRTGNYCDPVEVNFYDVFKNVDRSNLNSRASSRCSHEHRAKDQCHSKSKCKNKGKYITKSLTRSSSERTLYGQRLLVADPDVERLSTSDRGGRDNSRTIIYENVKKKNKSEKDVSTIEGETEKVTVPITLTMSIMTLYILGGAAIFCLWESASDYLKWSYFCFVTLSTIGFGDIVPGTKIDSKNPKEKLIALAVYVAVGLSVFSMCFQLMQEQVIVLFKRIGRFFGLIRPTKDPAGNLSSTMTMVESDDDIEMTVRPTVGKKLDQRVRRNHET